MHIFLTIATNQLLHGKTALDLADSSDAPGQDWSLQSQFGVKAFFDQYLLFRNLHPKKKRRKVRPSESLPDSMFKELCGCCNLSIVIASLHPLKVRNLQVCECAAKLKVCSIRQTLCRFHYCYRILHIQGSL